MDHWIVPAFGVLAIVMAVLCWWTTRVPEPSTSHYIRVRTYCGTVMEMNGDEQTFEQFLSEVANHELACPPCTADRERWGVHN